jgi:transcriptional regulator with XRE-family HTH domain
VTEQRVRTTPWSVLREEALRDPEVRAAYEKRRLAYELGRQVRRLRERAGLTQEELAERIHSTQGTIARLEAGGREPAVSTLARIAAALEAKVDVRLVPLTSPRSLAAAKTVRTTTPAARRPTERVGKSSGHSG